MTKLLQIQRKQALGVKLTGAENRLWEQHLMSSLMRAQERLVVSADNFSFVKTIDAEPIIDVVKHIGEVERPRKNDNGMLHLASVDIYTATNWSKECGHAIGTKPFVEYAKKKLMSGEYSKFKTQHKKRYVG